MMPRSVSFVSRACTVPRATPRRRETSISPMRGSVAIRSIRRASRSSRGVVIVRRPYLGRLRDVGRSGSSGRALLAARGRSGELTHMFEEAQLYSPVTQHDDGRVEVHLGEDHPGFKDPVYRERRNAIAAAAMAWTPGEPMPHVDYSEAEHEIWRTVCRELHAKHERYACREYLEGKAALALPEDRVPQLDEVTAGLQPLTGWEYHCAISTAPWPTGSSTPRSTCATRPSRSTPPSRTSSTRSSATGTCSPTRASPSSSVSPATPPVACRPTRHCSSSPTCSGSRWSSGSSARATRSRPTARASCPATER